MTGFSRFWTKVNFQERLV